MGVEAKSRRTHRDKLIAKQPHCVFCGGDTPATTVDHVPPRALFNNRLRPGGLEFSACKDCNSGSRKIEQAVQFITTLFRQEEPPASPTELASIVRNVIRSFPGLEDELQEREDLTLEQRIRARILYPGSIAVNAKGPLLTGIMRDFGAKLGLALHHEVTGRIVPATGFIVTAWYSNGDVLTDRKPLDIAQYLSATRTLVQGSWHVADQFEYASAWTEDGQASMHRAVFQDVVALDALVAENSEEFTQPPSADHYRRPGFLRALELPPLRFKPRS